MTYPAQPGFGYREVADLLRDRILSGDLPPEGRFLTIRQIQDQYGIGRDGAIDATQLLRWEGLLVVRQGQTPLVRRIYDKQPIDLTGVNSIESRMPTPRERGDLFIEEGVPVFVVRRVGVTVPELLPADRWYVGPSEVND